MKLKYVDISNFRSIHNVRLDFEPACRVLVGINESGKSNILRALSMIGAEFTPTPEDVREPLPQETPITEAFIRFGFTFDKDEMDKVYGVIKQKILTRNIDAPIISDGNKKFSLHSFCLSRNRGFFSVDILKPKKSAKYWTLADSYAALPNWKTLSATCPTTFTVQVGDTPVPLKNYVAVNTDEFVDIPKEYLEDLNPNKINELIGTEIVNLVSQSLPKVIFWKYDEKYLLPPSINLDAFIANPDSVAPLKNMFILAGITDIAGEVNQARQVSGGNKLRNLLHRVADHTTRHFRSVWKEYKEISFVLEPNATNVDANIKEQNHWKMSQRSDGVKRFITFLLHISANVKANVLNDALLLIDEPDMGLHPSGSRYLRDELIENSKKNYVVFSTHSIFMIDRENIGRHIIVKKDEEKTSITDADTSNFVDEEVLYNALNFSVFDILQKDNLIFEGWRDKQLFQTAFKRIPATHSADLKDLKEKIKGLGICHVDGVKDVRNITPLIELANRKCLIISDGDAPAKEKQKEYQKIKGYGDWKRYDEFASASKINTSEDFIKNSAMEEALKRVKKQHPTLTGDPILQTTGKLATIKKWLATQGVTGDSLKEILDNLKKAIFDDLKSSDIEDSYYDFLKDLSQLLAS